MKLFAKYFESAVSPAFYCLALWSCVLLSQFMIGKQSEFYRILKNVIVKLDKWSKSIQHSGCNIIPSKSNILSMKLFQHVTHTHDTLCHSLCHFNTPGLRVETLTDVTSSAPAGDVSCSAPGLAWTCHWHWALSSSHRSQNLEPPPPAAGPAWPPNSALHLWWADHLQ